MSLYDRIREPLLARILPEPRESVVVPHIEPPKVEVCDVSWDKWYDMKAMAERWVAAELQGKCEYVEVKSQSNWGCSQRSFKYEHVGQKW